MYRSSVGGQFTPSGGVPVVEPVKKVVGLKLKRFENVQPDTCGLASRET